MATGPSLSPPIGIEIEIGRGHAVGKGRPAGRLVGGATGSKAPLAREGRRGRRRWSDKVDSSDSD
jgi:hypothetical protein